MDSIATDKDQYALYNLLALVRIEILKIKFQGKGLEEFLKERHEQMVKEQQGQKVDSQFSNGEIQGVLDKLHSAKTLDKLLAIAKELDVSIPETKLQELRKTSEKLADNFLKSLGPQV